MPDWHWEPVTDDLLDGLPPPALAALRQVAEELTVPDSMIFLDGREFTGKPPGCVPSSEATGLRPRALRPRHPATVRNATEPQT